MTSRCLFETKNHKMGCQLVLHFFQHIPAALVYPLIIIDNRKEGSQYPPPPPVLTGLPLLVSCASCWLATSQIMPPAPPRAPSRQWLATFS